jgi:hypothetical protein
MIKLQHVTASSAFANSSTSTLTLSYPFASSLVRVFWNEIWQMIESPIGRQFAALLQEQILACSRKEVKVSRHIMLISSLNSQSLGSFYQNTNRQQFERCLFVFCRFSLTISGAEQCFTSTKLCLIITSIQFGAILKLTKL